MKFVSLIDSYKVNMEIKSYQAHAIIFLKVEKVSADFWVVSDKKFLNFFSEIRKMQQIIYLEERIQKTITKILEKTQNFSRRDVKFSV